MSIGRRSRLCIVTLCIAIATVSGGVSACTKKDSQPASESQSQASETSSVKPSTPVTGTAGRLPTLGDYIEQNKITETQAKHDDPEVPKITLPTFPGWEDAGDATPDYAYNAIVGVDPALQPDPPSAIAVLSKLTGNVDPAQILALAPNELRNLPDFKGSDPQNGKVSGFDSTSISGTYTRDGQPRVIEQTTVVIPVKDAFYVLQINVEGVKDQTQILMQVVEALTENSTIEVRP